MYLLFNSNFQLCCSEAADVEKIFNVCTQALDVCCSSVHMNSAQAHPLARYA